MGLFNFFKPNGNKAGKKAEPKAQLPECDVTKTQVIVDLYQVPNEQRDNYWREAFFENVQTASFACGNPQVFTGPDGFPYFVLRTPESNQPFESFCIRNLKDFLLEKGLGVAINPNGNSVDWVFSYGDIVNLHLNKEFFTKTDSLEFEEVETIKKDEEVLVAQPSESYLPGHVRQALRAFLKNLGIKTPKIMMVCRARKGQITQFLAFNIYQDDYASTDQLKNRLKQIGWFLPRHYAVLVLPKNSNFEKSFLELY